ncbi:programmed cell death protein 2-like [Limulus polyphemus]|uniref:Programmed cell death protein 2-like n=1 Tax=Limulus polyphemus TaxID=6850 RepID=A0ABM1B0L6_LIMPO|nr:programmed cell death protein 2-like [Limulus polyphemus]
MSAHVLLGLSDEKIVDDDGDHCSWQTNKYGGKPNWMPSIISPDATTLQCPLCGHCMALVIQVYCPLGSSKYHRTLYIFCCTNPLCWSKPESWKVIRCQEEDKQTAENPDGHSVCTASTDMWLEQEDDWGEASTAGLLEETSHLCITNEESEGGEKNDNLEVILDPEEDKKQFLEDPGIQEDDLEKCVSEEECKFLQSGQTSVIVEDRPIPDHSGERLKSVLGERRDHSIPPHVVPVFEPYYIYVIEEPSESGMSRELYQKHKKYQQEENVFYSIHKKSAVEKKTTSEGYEKSQVKHGDRVFYKFMNRIARCPEQIIRYCWEGDPLYVTEPSSGIKQPLPCQACGSQRVFELQLMPSLIQHLKLKNFNVDGPVVEFGTVLISSCSKSCWKEGDVMKEEFVFVQADPDEKLLAAFGK